MGSTSTLITRSATSVTSVPSRFSRTPQIPRSPGRIRQRWAQRLHTPLPSGRPPQLRRLGGLAAQAAAGGIAALERPALDAETAGLIEPPQQVEALHRAARDGLERLAEPGGGPPP